MRKKVVELVLPDYPVMLGYLIDQKTSGNVTTSYFYCQNRMIAVTDVMHEDGTDEFDHCEVLTDYVVCKEWDNAIEEWKQKRINRLLNDFKVSTLSDLFRKLNGIVLQCEAFGNMLNDLPHLPLSKDNLKDNLAIIVDCCERLITDIKENRI